MNIDLNNNLQNSLDSQESDMSCKPSTKNMLSTIDLIFRILFTIASLTNYFIRKKSDPNFYNNSESKIMLFTIIFILIGIQNCSIAFYPWIKNLRILVYITFIILMVFTSLKDSQTLMFIGNESADKDFIYKVSEFLFYFILLPNLTSIIMFCVLVVILVFFFLIMNVLARLGLVRFRFNFAENPRDINAIIFKKKYLKKLKGSFYKEKLAEDIEMKSLLEDKFVNSDDYEQIRKALSEDLNLKEENFEELHNKTFIKKNFEDFDKSFAKIKNFDETKKFEDSEHLCSICFSKFNNLSYVLELPECKHIFHFKCIVSWLETHPNCPCCRSDLLVYFQNLENPQNQ